MELLNHSIKTKTDGIDNGTRMSDFQPLGIIYKEKETTANGEEVIKNGYKVICDMCQIPNIVGTCTKCGLYQYGDKFDIQLRRK